MTLDVYPDKGWRLSDQHGRELIKLTTIDLTSSEHSYSVALFYSCLQFFWLLLEVCLVRVLRLRSLPNSPHPPPPCNAAPAAVKHIYLTYQSNDRHRILFSKFISTLPDTQLLSHSNTVLQSSPPAPRAVTHSNLTTSMRNSSRPVEYL